MTLSTHIKTDADFKKHYVTGECCEVSKEQFLAFEGVRRSGICNMFDTQMIMEVTDLSSEDISQIRRNYSKLKKQHL